MTMRPLSEIIEMVLNGLDEDAQAVGAAEAGKKMAGRSRNGAARQFTAAKPCTSAREENCGVRLVWVNPATIGGRTKLMRRPMLEVVT